MYDFLRLQYIMGHITAEQLQTYVPRWLTNKQAEEIIAAPKQAKATVLNG